MAEVIPSRSRRDAPTTLTRSGELPDPPAHLSERSAGIWREICAAWVIDVDALPILRAALEQLDLYDQARAELDRDGLTVATGQGMLRAHPAHKISQDALASFRQCFRQLALTPPEVV